MAQTEEQHKAMKAKSFKSWRLRNIEKRKKYMLDWRKKNAIHIKEYDVQKRKEDGYAEKKKKWDKTYYDLHSRKIMEHVYSRRQKFGYNRLNEKFIGSVGHHINKNDVIYIPEELHKSIPHSQGDIKSMIEINNIAFNYLGMV